MPIGARELQKLKLEDKYDCGLPKRLVQELVCTAVILLNEMPNEIIDEIMFCFLVHFIMGERTDK